MVNLISRSSVTTIAEELKVEGGLEFMVKYFQIVLLQLLE